MANSSMDREPLVWLREQLEHSHPDLLREMMAAITQQLMAAEAQEACGTEYGERSAERVKRATVIACAIGTPASARSSWRCPSFARAATSRTSCWRRRRAERAMVAVIAQAYLAGVSTRRLEALVQTLGIRSISKSQVSELCNSLDPMVADFRNRPLDSGPCRYVWVDGLTQRCRDGGRIVNVVTAIATGVNADGRREILGVDVFAAEDAAAWSLAASSA